MVWLMLPFLLSPCLSVARAELRQNHVFDGVMRNHVAGSDFIYFEAKGTVSDFFEGRADAGFVFTHGLGIGQARRFGVVLRLPETAIVPADEDLHL